MSAVRDEIQKEIVRCRRLMVEYQKIPMGGFGLTVIGATVAAAEEALEKESSDEVLQWALDQLRGCE